MTIGWPGNGIGVATGGAAGGNGMAGDNACIKLAFKSSTIADNE